MLHTPRRRVLGGSALAAAVLGLLATTLSPIGPAVGTETIPDLMRDADEQVSVVEVALPDQTELDRLVDTGVDLDHAAHRNPDGTLTAHAVVSPSEVAALRARGFTVGETLHDADDTEDVLAERDATIAAAHRRERGVRRRAPRPPTVSDVKIIRADYYTSFGVGYLSVEAKWAEGQTNSAQLVVQRDSGPGTEIGQRRHAEHLALRRRERLPLPPRRRRRGDAPRHDHDHEPDRRRRDGEGQRLAADRRAKARAARATRPTSSRRT